MYFTSAYTISGEIVRCTFGANIPHVYFRSMVVSFDDLIMCNEIVHNDCILIFSMVYFLIFLQSEEKHFLCVYINVLTNARETRDKRDV